ncbi:unnamed protein product [marine sediment metagenome]|uniref:Uncharacterized protein n=1 Tax=marine sediment metagenome TaxID=412755 RepID=X1C006_9ZZZZ
MIIAEREPVWDKKEDQKNHIILSEYRDFEKQYDAESHPRLRNINERKFCFGKCSIASHAREHISIDFSLSLGL